MSPSGRLVDREVKGQPSSPRVALMYRRYLEAPLMIDTEYLRLYTQAHRATDGLHVLERRAECHARALEGLTPVIRPGEPFAGSKTRFVRGAIPYCHYASRFISQQFGQVRAEAQDEAVELGDGGGIARSRELAGRGEHVMFGQRFLLAKEELPVLADCAAYFEDKCLQGVGDALWKTAFPRADYIEKGWRAGLYSAPHDPAPEGRYVLDFETALGQGFRALVARMRELIATTEVTDPRSADRIYFWRAGIRVLEATIAWAGRYADRAEELAGQTADPADRARLMGIAEACRRVPAEPPRSFREAVQAFWLIYLAGHIEGAQLGYSPGRFDRYMYPYFRRDREAGRLGEGEALELLEALRVKMTELEYVASLSWEGLGSGNLFQNLILGGLDERGRPADNELSRLVIQAAINCPTTQPTLSIWYDEGLGDAFLLKAVECVKTGCGFPAWFNLKVYLQHELARTRLPLAVIRKYAAMGGCTEPTLEGMSHGIVQPGFINHAKVLELALFGGRDPVSGLVFAETPLPASAGELKDAYRFHLAETIRNWQRYWNYVMAAHRQTCALVYSSTLVRDCLARGLCLDDGGAVNNDTPTTLSSGLVNVANALAAVEALAEDDEPVGLDAIREACRRDWAGHEELHRRILAAPKWGNNQAAVDDVFLNLFDAYCDLVAAQTNYLGRPYDPSMLAISTPVPFGKVTGATPDGRMAGEPLADGVSSPMPGSDRRGPLAALLSAGKLDHARIRGGLHNLKFHPATLHGLEGSRKLLQLIRAYFAGLGFQLQFNVVDSGMLRAAQEHPDDYRDLIVRVAGFSAFFVELGREVQDQIIARTEHAL